MNTIGVPWVLSKTRGSDCHKLLESPMKLDCKTRVLIVALLGCMFSNTMI